jgi:hypothetical protein
MPTPVATPALAAAGAMDQVPMAAAARAAIQKRKYSDIFPTPSVFVLRAQASPTPGQDSVNICRVMPPATPTLLALIGDMGTLVLARGPIGEISAPATVAQA